MSKVFIIDDDPIHQRIAQIMIEKYHIFSQQESYTEALKALEFLETHKSDPSQLPDVILLDLNMPIFNGWDFLNGFKKLVNPDMHIKIFIVSSSVDENDKIRAKNYSFVHGFISKPLSPDIIRSIL